MFGSEILGVAIGLVFVYLLLSLICSAIREAIEGVLKTRAVQLQKGIRQLLRDTSADGLADALYRHPLISSLCSGNNYKRRDLPSYVPARNFALALMDLVVRGKELTSAENAGPASPWISCHELRASIQKIDNVPCQRALLPLIDAANGDLAQAQANIQAWFDSSMDRVSGWYKRKTQGILFVIGLAVSIAINVDTLTIATTLYKDDGKREAIVAQAAQAGSLQNNDIDQLSKEIDKLKLPIGWPPGPLSINRLSMESFWAGILGWLITAFAVTLGAPFWFDVLNKFMVVRSTVKPHEKSPEEASEDRQTSSSQQQPNQGGAPDMGASSRSS